MKENEKNLQLNENSNYKRIEKGEKNSKNKMNEKINPQISINNIFLYIFLTLSVVLTITLYLYYKFNSDVTDELFFVKDIHKLKANFHEAHFVQENAIAKKIDFKRAKINKISGYLEINEIFEGISMIGKVQGLAPGSTHGVHIIEYSDILEYTEGKPLQGFPNTFTYKNIEEIKLTHFNPKKLKHSCPSLNDKENYHFGDLGNIIADNEGKAFLSSIRKIPIKSLNGRVVIISNSPDKCQENIESDNLADVISFGPLNVVKPIISEKNNGSQEYFLREINTAKKAEFDKKNIKDTHKEKDRIKSRENNKKNTVKKVEKKINNNNPLIVKENLNIINNNKIPERKLKINVKHEENKNHITHSVKKDSNPHNSSINHSHEENHNENNNKNYLNIPIKKGIFDSESEGIEIKPNPHRSIFDDPSLSNENNINNPAIFETGFKSNNEFKPVIPVIKKEFIKKNKNNENNETQIFKEFDDIIKSQSQNSEIFNTNEKNEIKHQPIISNNYHLNNGRNNPPKNLYYNNHIQHTEPIAHKFTYRVPGTPKNYPIYYPNNNHNEHHDIPKFPAYEKPKVKKIPEFKQNIKNESDEDLFKNLLIDLDKENGINKKEKNFPFQNNKQKKSEPQKFTFKIPKKEKTILEKEKDFDMNLADEEKDDKFFPAKIEKIPEKINVQNKQKKNSNGKKNLNKLFEDVVKEEENSKRKNMKVGILDEDDEDSVKSNQIKFDKELKRIPISLAQFEDDKEKDVNKVNHLKKVNINNSKLKRSDSAKISNNSSNEFSFMSTNLEPIVNKIVTNTTASDVLHNLDLNLIDPYKIADMDEIKETDNKDNKEKKIVKNKKPKKDNEEIFDLDKFDEEIHDFDISNINEDKKFVNNFTEEIKKNHNLNLTDLKAKKNTNNPKVNGKNASKKITNTKSPKKTNAALLETPEDIYKLEVGNIENYQDILKNKTLNDLEKLPDRPFEFPSKENEPKKTNIKTQNSKKIKEKEKKPHAAISNSSKKNTNSLMEKINSKENFRFLSKLSNSRDFDLLKFKQNDAENIEPEKSENLKEKKESENNSIFDIFDEEKDFDKNEKKKNKIDEINNIEKTNKKLNENIELDLQRKINLTKKSNSALSSLKNQPIESSLIENFSKNLETKMGVFSKDILGKENKNFALKKKQEKVNKKKENSVKIDEGLQKEIQELSDIFEDDPLPLMKNGIDLKPKNKIEKNLKNKNEKFDKNSEPEKLYSTKAKNVDEDKLFYHHFKKNLPLKFSE